VQAVFELSRRIAKSTEVVSLFRDSHAGAHAHEPRVRSELYDGDLALKAEILRRWIKKMKGEHHEAIDICLYTLDRR
jgi:hypothetical protein